MRVGLLLTLLLSSAAVAAPTRFEIEQTTTFGDSVFVVGDHPALGDGDVTRALKLSPTDYPTWFVEVDLPPGTEIDHRYILRDDDPSQIGNAANATDLTASQTLTTPGETPPPRFGTLVYLSTATAPVLEILQEGGGHRRIPFIDAGEGRAPGERRWRAELSDLPPTGDWQFRIDLGDGSHDTPAYGDHFLTSLTTAHLQDGHLFNYTPAPTISPSRVIKTSFSGSLDNGGSRPIYIYLPRGYDEHTQRRYPVLHMHDGQNCFQAFVQDSFAGSWRADETADLLIQQGRMRECIIVGVGNSPDRFAEYIPEYSGGAADDTVVYYRDEIKPWVDSMHRTLTGRDDTAVCGSSLGGLLSTYFAWEVPDFAAHHAGLSSSFQFAEIITRLGNQSPRAMRLWIDSGTAGSGDGMHNTFAARDALLANGYALGDDFQHLVDIGAGHNEQSWAARLDQVFLFLLPISQEPNDFLPAPSGFLLR